MTHSTIKNYNRRANKYEQRWQKYLHHTHENLLEYLEITSNDIILDASAGTGLLLQKIISRNLPFGHFTLNDPSEKMLDIARQRFSDHAEISFHNEYVQRLSYPANTFNTIISLNAFHFYRDQQQVLEHFYRILKPGGQLYILDWNREGFFRIVNKIIDWTASEYINTLAFSEINELLTNTGFSIRASEKWSWRYWKFLLVKAEKVESN